MTPSPLKATKPLEGGLKAAVLKQLDVLEAMGRCMVLRQQSGHARGGKIRMGKPGTPDILVLLPHGDTVWLELKRPDGKYKRSSGDKTRIAQAKWHADAARLGHTVHIITSVQDAISAVLP